MAFYDFLKGKSLFWLVHMYKMIAVLISLAPRVILYSILRPHVLFYTPKRKTEKCQIPTIVICGFTYFATSLATRSFQDCKARHMVSNSYTKKIQKLGKSFPFNLQRVWSKSIYKFVLCQKPCIFMEFTTCHCSPIGSPSLLANRISWYSNETLGRSGICL